MADLKAGLDKIKKTADDYIDGMMNQMVKDGADTFFVAIVNGPLREFVKLIDVAHVKGYDPEIVRGGTESLVTSALLELTSRMVPRNNLDASQVYVQQMINTIANELAFSLPSQFGSARPPTTQQ